MNTAIVLQRGYALEDLPDAELLTATRGLVGRSNQLLAALLAHLAEVEARGVHRERACASLYTYCIYELRFRRTKRSVVSAQRASCGVSPRCSTQSLRASSTSRACCCWGHTWTEQNLTEVLARAKHRTKKEVLRLVRQLDPLPQLSPRIEPLGPASNCDSELVRSARAMGLETLQHPVRDLQPGDRPRDWMMAQDSATDAATDAAVGSEQQPFVLAEEKEPPQRYGIQFEATEEYVRLFDEAQALLSHAAPNLSLSDLHLRALRSFVTELKRKKFAVVDKPRSSSTADSVAPNPRQSVECSADSVAPNPRQSGESPSRAGASNAPPHATLAPRQRGRHVPAAVRRAVYQRDQARCTYLDDAGRRCGETNRLELHHVDPFAHGGAETTENLTLRCEAHNSLAAEQDFGRAFVAARRELRHESLVAQPQCSPTR